MDKKEFALKQHEEWAGKIEVISRASVSNKEELSVAYTPGVAEPCLEIQKDVDLSYKYTGRVVSYEVHYTKPQKEIYEILLSKYNLKPEESLFFDDREENVQTAVSLGISGCVVKSREHINKELESLLY